MANTGDRRVSDVELQALTAIVTAETVEREGCIRQFGERLWDYRTEALVKLEDELQRRNILK